jgi:hypothetical protein
VGLFCGCQSCPSGPWETWKKAYNLVKKEGVTEWTGTFKSLWTTYTFHKVFQPLKCSTVLQRHAMEYLSFMCHSLIPRVMCSPPRVEFLGNIPFVKKIQNKHHVGVVDSSKTLKHSTIPRLCWLSLTASWSSLSMQNSQVERVRLNSPACLYMN